MLQLLLWECHKDWSANALTALVSAAVGTRKCAGRAIGVDPCGEPIPAVTTDSPCLPTIGGTVLLLCEAITRVTIAVVTQDLTPVQYRRWVAFWAVTAALSTLLGTATLTSGIKSAVSNQVAYERVTSALYIFMKLTLFGLKPFP